MSERLEKIADEILAVVNKKRVSGETPEKDVWVATYLPNREQIAVIFGDREVSGSYVQKRFNKDDKQSIISELEKLYGDEPKNHNEEALGEDTVYDHSWYEVEKQKYPKRTKEGVVCETLDEFPDINLLLEEETNWRKYNGFYDVNKDSYYKLPLGQHHREYFDDNAAIEKGIFRYGVTEYKGHVICFINSDTRGNAIKVMKRLNNTILKEVPIEYFMIEYFDNGKRIRTNIDINGREIFENKNDWFCSPENVEKRDGVIIKECSKNYKQLKEEGVIIKEEDLEETCSGGATGVGAVCETPGSVASVKRSVSKVTRAACLPKRKKKKMSESIDSILFKESILNDMPCESKIEGHQFKYFMNEGKWYLSVDNCLVKTHGKDVMMETFDQIVDNEKVTTSLLEDYSCYEMELLMEEDIADSQANPLSNTKLNSDPVNTDSSSSVSLNNPETIATIAGGELLNTAKEAEKNEPPKTSEELAKEDLHNQEVLGAENKEGTIEKDGKTEDIKIGKTIDIKGKKNAATLYTDKEGNQQVALTKDINLKKV